MVGDTVPCDEADTQSSMCHVFFAFPSHHFNQANKNGLFL